MINKRFSNIDSSETNNKKVLDAVSKVQGAAALGSLGYGAAKLGQVGKSVYDGTKGNSSVVGKLWEAKKRAGKILKKSNHTFRTLNTSSQVIDELEKKAKEKITKSKEDLSNSAKKILEANKNGTLDFETYNSFKKKKEKLKEGIKKHENAIKGLQRQRGYLKDIKNLKKAKIAGGVALATGAASIGTKLVSKRLKKKELQKRFSIESGAPDKKGSLMRELGHKAKVGSVLGSIAGGTLGLTIGGTLAGTLRDIKLAPIITLGGLGIGTLVGAISKMSEAIGAGRRLKNMKEIGINEVLDYLEDSIIDENSKGYGIRGRNLISRYISLDGSPTTFDLNIILKEGIGLLIVKKGIENKVDTELEKLVENNRLADYSSEKIKGGWIVKIIVPSIKAFANFIYNLCYTHHLRVNIITQEQSNDMIILRTKKYARRDYEGLDELAKNQLKADRSELADRLWKKRASINKEVGRRLDNLKTAKNVYIDTSVLPKEGEDMYYRAVEAAHGKGVRDMVQDINYYNNTAPIEKKIKNYRNSEYHDKLWDTNRFAKDLREDALEDTKRRARRAAAEESYNASRTAKSVMQTTAPERSMRNNSKGIIKRAANWAKSNPIPAAGIAIGGITAAGYGAKKLIDRKRNEGKKNT